jgi:hypothetical protein
MNTAKALPANIIIGSNHGYRISSNSNYSIWGNNSNVADTEVRLMGYSNSFTGH